MKASMKALVLVLTVGSLGLAAGSASACGHGGYGGSFGYGSYRPHKVYVKKVYVHPVVVEPCYYPFHSFAIVNPGDTWFTLSLREYGKPHLWKKIAIFNGLPLNAGLIPGMQLKLPVIHPNGVLLPSSAPAPVVATAAPLTLPQGGLPPAGGIPQANFAPQTGGIAPQANMIPPSSSAPQGASFAPQGPQANVMNPEMIQNAPSMGQPTGPIGAPSMSAPTAPAASIRPASTEAKLPSVAIGSILSLDGQSLGNDRGNVRLLVNGLALPIDVLEWNATVVKVQLPQLDLAGAIRAEI
jgi:hypothetical protein